MKRKVLSIALALLMCLTIALPTFADNSAETPPERYVIQSSYDLFYLYGIQYKMSADIINILGDSITVTLALYDVSYNYITSVSKTTTDQSIKLFKDAYLQSGTYHLRLTYRVDGTWHSFEKTYIV